MKIWSSESPWLVGISVVILCCKPQREAGAVWNLKVDPHCVVNKASTELPYWAMQCSTDPDLDVKRSAMKKTVRHLIFLHGLLQSVLAVFPYVCWGQKKGVFPCVGGQKRGGLCFPCLCLLGPKEGWSLFSPVFVGAKIGLLRVFPCVGAKRGVVTVFLCLCLLGPKEGWSLFSPMFVGSKRGVFSLVLGPIEGCSLFSHQCLLGPKERCSLFYPVFVGAERGVFSVLPCLCLLGPKEGCSVFYPVCVCWGQKRGVHCFTLSVFVGAKRGVFTVLPCQCLLGPKEGCSLFYPVCLLGPKEGCALFYPVCVCWGPKRGVHRFTLCLLGSKEWCSLFTLSVFVDAQRGVVSVFPCLLAPKEGWSLFYPVYWRQKRGGHSSGWLSSWAPLFFTVYVCGCQGRHVRRVGRSLSPEVAEDIRQTQSDRETTPHLMAVMLDSGSQTLRMKSSMMMDWAICTQVRRCWIN